LTPNTLQAYRNDVKYLGMLVIQTLIVLAALPAAVLLITVIFHPDPASDDALGIAPFYIITMIVFTGLAGMVNVIWLHQRQDAPRWLPWYIRLVARTLVVGAFFVVLLAWNPKF
jgi:hypothetical protein